MRAALLLDLEARTPDPCAAPYRLTTAERRVRCPTPSLEKTAPRAPPTLSVNAGREMGQTGRPGPPPERCFQWGGGDLPRAAPTVDVDGDDQMGRTERSVPLPVHPRSLSLSCTGERGAGPAGSHTPVDADLSDAGIREGDCTSKQGKQRQIVHDWAGQCRQRSTSAPPWDTVCLVWAN